MKADKFNYTATETIHYHCPCCAAEWQSNKLPYCPNCEVKIEYASQSPEPNMTSLELFEHRYNKGQKFSWLEMLDFAEAYASQSPEPNKELRNIVSDAMDALAMDIAATKEVDVSIHVDALTRKLEPNTVTEEDFKKYLYDKFMKVLPDLAFKEILSEGYADDIIEWLQQTQAVTELTYVECSARQATHYIIKEPGDSACYPVKLLNQKK